MKSDDRGNLTGLAYYIREVLYDDWKDDRKDLEVKWQKNLDAFTSVSTESWKKEEGKDWRSNTFVQMTKIKVLSGYSMVIDMLLQGGKFPFTLIPSPLDNVVLEDLPDDEREVIEDSIEDMTGLIHQQLQDCKADRQLMKCTMSGAVYGETYAEFYVDEIERKGFKEVQMAPDGIEQGNSQRFERFSEEISAPAFEYVPVWDIFRDIEGDSGYIRRMMTSPYELFRLKDDPYFIKEGIEKAIASADEPGGSQHGGEEDSTLPPILRDIKHRKKVIERLRFWGRIPRILAEDFEKTVLKGKEEDFGLDTEYDNDGDEVEVLCELADNEVIRYVRNDTGKKPLYRAVWEDKLDHAESTGIPDNLTDTQGVLNGMVRAFEDNIKLISNVIIAVKKRYLAPGALKKGIKPGEEIEIAEECDDVRKAIQQVVIQDITGGLVNGIGLFERYADEASQIPKIMQGAVNEKQKPDTLGELNILQQNSGRYLGGVIKNYDEGMIEPVTQDFYEYNMDDPQVTRGKGNFIAQALGFTSFQDRIMRLQKLMQGIQLVLSSDILTAEVKLREVLQDIWKALDLDPSQVLKSPEEKQEEAEQAMEMRAQEEARVRQLQAEQLQMAMAAKEHEHDLELETEDVEHEHDMEENEQKFGHDLVLKSVNFGGEGKGNG